MPIDPVTRANAEEALLADMLGGDPAPEDTSGPCAPCCGIPSNLGDTVTDNSDSPDTLTDAIADEDDDLDGPDAYDPDADDDSADFD